MRHKGSAADAALPRAGLAVAAVAAVIVLVTAGFPLASAALPDQQPLAAGTVLVIGPGQAHSARLTVGRGWALLKAESNQDQLDSLRLGAVQLTVAYIALLDRGQAGDLWAGLDRIIRSGHPGSRLGAARLMADVPGEVEDTGSLTGGGLTGQAEVLADPPLDFAIEITALAPQGADAAGLRAAALVARSLRIAAP